MHRHQTFDLLLHDDEELAEFVGSPVSNRTTIHEWPLSCVQRICTENGDSYIYKVQAPPTLEAEFYARAQSPLLVSVRILETKNEMTVMLMEEVKAPRVNDIPMKEAEAVALGKELIEQIAQIDGDLPVFTDISTEERWATYIGAALDDIRTMIDDGSFHQVNLKQVNQLQHWSEAPSLLNAIRSPLGFVHADLKAENVLVTGNGYRVLDWQRPIRGPVSLDIATLLNSMGIDPVQYVPIGIIQLYHFLHIAWFAQAAKKWVPQGKPMFDGIIARIGHELELLERNA